MSGKMETLLAGTIRSCFWMDGAGLRDKNQLSFKHIGWDIQDKVSRDQILNPEINRKLLTEDVNCKMRIVCGVLKSMRLDEIVKTSNTGERKRRQ